MTAEQARDAEWRRGTLPPGHLGWRKATEIRDQANLLAIEATQYRTADAEPYDVDIELGGGRRPERKPLPAVYGTRLVSVTYSKLDGKHLLASWIPLLALFARDARRDWSAACIGRPKRGTNPRVEEIGRPDGDAVEVLRELVAIYDAGRREPLPLPVKTSYAWAVARYEGDDPEMRRDTGGRPIDSQERISRRAHERAWGKGAPLSDLMTPLRRVRSSTARRTGSAPTPADSGCRCFGPRGSRRDGALRPARLVAGRKVHHRAAGQRGHRQDVRVGRAGDALSRRGKATLIRCCSSPSVDRPAKSFVNGYAVKSSMP